MVKETLTSTYQEVQGAKEKHRRRWISMEALEKIQERRKKKKTAINNNRIRAEQVKSQAEYTEVTKQMRKSIKVDKHRYVEHLATTLG
ncbi:unnamed protein product [Schistosoma margrebowiei]|uniref:Uncharacterized protein n=1 Tax=Schistosoma margrebowiei TaxID=48269 RepID=A0A183LTI5_9TREM|nr:unnamed protein product [Schistosoma margrebowiei]